MLCPDEIDLEAFIKGLRDLDHDLDFTEPIGGGITIIYKEVNIFTSRGNYSYILRSIKKIHGTELWERKI